MNLKTHTAETHGASFIAQKESWKQVLYDFKLSLLAKQNSIFNYTELLWLFKF